MDHDVTVEIGKRELKNQVEQEKRENMNSKISLI
jgi:hypothetical protein